MKNIFLKRIKKFFECLSDYKNEFVLINDPTNVYYYSGFNSTNAFILLSPEKKYFLTDSRYVFEAKNKVNHLEVLNIRTNFYKLILEKIRNRKLVVFSRYISLDFYTKLKKYILKKNLLISDFDLAELRQKKDSNEVKKIQNAVKILEKTFTNFPKLIYKNMTELDLKNELEYQMKKNGATDIAFDTIVLFDKKTSFPHGHSGNDRLKKKDIILIDIGAKYLNYCSDLTRIFFFGEPEDSRKKIYLDLLDIQKNSIRLVRENYKISLIEKFILKELEKNELENFYLHSTGHGVGLDIHELPVINRKVDSYLCENQVITIEPGVYFDNKFGYRIEDTVLVKKSGADVLTKNISKEFEDSIID
jgi:Xaa-Pro aminopeptidase